MKAFVKAFTSKRVGMMVPLGFASGLPNSVTGTVLSAWMAAEGVRTATVGLFSFVTLPYNFKFLWAPLFDRFRLPWLGRRRGWMVVLQLCLLVAIGVMGTFRPTEMPTALAVAALLVAVLSASLDIVTDAYRTDVLPPNERASGTAVFVAAYRLALAVGAGALILSDQVPWQTVYWVLAALMVLGVVATVAAPRTEEVARPPEKLTEAVIAALREFLSRPGAAAALCVIMLYKLGDAFAGHLLVQFLHVGLGFSMTEIGAVAKGLGMAASIVGALVGGGLVAEWGLRRSLLLFGVLQAVANALYAILGVVGKSHLLLVVSIGADNFFGGLGTAAFVAFLMALCNKRFTATQYALLSSASTLLGKTLGMGSGFIAEWIGWPLFFILTIVIAAPALAILHMRRALFDALDPEPES